MRVVFIGPPGSGKGTQAKLLQDRLGLVCIGTGDILREAVAQGTALGKAAAPFMEAGQLVPDGLVDELVAERLRRPDRPEGFVLDGYPRTPAQARALDAVLAGLGLPLTAVIVFRIDDEVVVRRMLGRHRSDDSEATARLRLRLFHDSARELIAHYRKQGLLFEVPADDLVENLYTRISGIVQS
jgi:adenylate kinase